MDVYFTQVKQRNPTVMLHFFDMLKGHGFGVLFLFFFFCFLAFPHILKDPSSWLGIEPWAHGSEKMGS